MWLLHDQNLCAHAVSIAGKLSRRARSLLTHRPRHLHSVSMSDLIEAFQLLVVDVAHSMHVRRIASKVVTSWIVEVPVALELRERSAIATYRP
jgi:hypothetical protein